MGLAAQLGKEAALLEKQALNPMPLFRGLGSAARAAFKSRPVMTAGAGALGLSAANDAAAGMGLPHLGGRRHWNPSVQKFRMQHTPGVGAGLANWFKRPVQSLMAATGHVRDPGLSDLIQWDRPQMSPGQFSIDPTTGRVTLQPQQMFGNADPALLQYLSQVDEKNLLARQLGAAAGRGGFADAPPPAAPPAAAGPPAAAPPPAAEEQLALDRNSLNRTF